MCVCVYACWSAFLPRIYRREVISIFSWGKFARQTYISHFLSNSLPAHSPQFPTLFPLPPPHSYTEGNLPSKAPGSLEILMTHAPDLFPNLARTNTLVLFFHGSDFFICFISACQVARHLLNTRMARFLAEQAVFLRVSRQIIANIWKGGRKSETIWKQARPPRLARHVRTHWPCLRKKSYKNAASHTWAW